MPIEYQPAKGIPSDDFPVNLITGRNLYHWHSGSMTHQSPELFEMSPRGKVEINPEQATALECATGDIVEISSLQGTIRAVVEVSEKSPPGVAFIPMHFTESPVNQLTSSSLDPLAKTPGFKICPVNIQKVNQTKRHPSAFFGNMEK